MSEQIGSAPWMEQWFASQRETWTRLLSGMAGAQAAQMPKFPPNPLLALGSDVPRSAQDAARKMLQLSESFLGLTRGFWEVLQQREARGASTSGAGGPAGDWADALERMRRAMGGELTKLFALPADQNAWLAGWQQLATNFANAGQALQGAAGLMPQMPGIPGISPELWPRLMKAGLRYQQALARLASLLTRVGGEAVDTLAKLVGPESKSPPTSLRAVYDLWVECGEKAYSAASHGVEFAAAQQELNDAIADLRQLQQQIGESWMRMFDLPTRVEINTINRRVMTLRRRLREVEEELETLRRSR
jgi:hypothetical protein